MESDDQPTEASSAGQAGEDSWPVSKRDETRVTVELLLEAKGHDVWSVRPEEPVDRALELMAEHNIGALLVMEDDQLQGIFSERDYARKVNRRGDASLDTPVQEIMTRKVHVIEPDDTLFHAIQLMTDKRFRHLPVVEDEQVIGVISIGDVVKKIIEQQDFKIGELENYISGTR